MSTYWSAWFNRLEPLLQMRLFQINQTPVTVSSVLLFLAVLLAFGMASRLFCRAVLGRVLQRFHVDDGTRFNLQRMAHYLIMLIGALIAFQIVGIDLSGLVVVFGLLSVGIGFGLQNITSNFVAGLILLIERPISVGDRITIGDIEGDVMDIRMRATIVRSLQNISIIVPNAEFVSSRVVNWSHGDPKIRIEASVGVAYGSDLDKVVRCLREVAEQNDEVMRTPAPEVLHGGFGDSSWDMRLRVWIANPKRHPYVESDLYSAIVHKFRENGVEIPFPQRDLHIRSSVPVPVAGPEKAS